MKYIRTKDGRIIENKLTMYVCPEVLKELSKCEYSEEIEILKQADSIEELCDYVFYIENNEQKVFKFPKECDFNFIKDLFLRGFVKDLKFAILTDKGLIYVAKMNDKGELELL